MKSIFNIQSAVVAAILTLTLALPASASHKTHKAHALRTSVSIVRNAGPVLDGHETHGGPHKNGPLFDGQETHGGPK